MNIKNMKIQHKYIISVNILIIFIMIIFYISDYQNTKKYIYEHTKDDLKSIGQVIISTIETISDYDRMQNVLTEFSQFNKEYEIIIVDRNSRIIASTSPFTIHEKFVENNINKVLTGELNLSIAENYHKNRKVLDLTLPFFYSDNPGQVRGAIHIAQTIEAIYKSLSILRRNHIIYMFITAVLLSLIINVLTYELIIKKIKYLSRIMSLIESGNWNEKVQISSEDEFGQLGKIFNGMLGRLIEITKNLEKALKEKNELYKRVQNFNVELQENIERTTEKLVKTQKELIKKEKLATIGEMAAGIAHEIRNPLLIIEGSAEMLQKDDKLGDNEKMMLNDIIEEVERLNRSVREILDFSRPVVPEYKRIDICALIKDCLRRTIPPDTKKVIEHELHCDDTNRYINSDPELLKQIFINLFSNSVQAIKSKGKIAVTVEAAHKHIIVKINDTGEGISKESLPKIFDPFYSSKTDGIGLGLAIVKRIIESLRGEITVESEKGRGTVFKIKLPKGEKKEM